MNRDTFDQQRWREDLQHELRELRALGVFVPDLALEMAKAASPNDYPGASNSEVCDLLVALGQVGAA